MWPSVEELMERFKTACNLKQAVDHARIKAAFAEWNAQISQQILPVRIAQQEADVLAIAKAARDARDAWAARAAWDARAARDAWAARAARAAWDARDARAAWDARDAWAAWAARAAWDARDARAARDAWAAWDASWEISWLAPIVIGARQTEDHSTFAKWFPLFLALEAGAFAFWITDREIVVAELPAVVSVDGARRLHAEHGPAFDWLGVKDFYWYGVHVPELAIMHPEKITLGMIDKERNAEVRRVLIERYGVARWATDKGAHCIHQDGHGRLLRCDVKDRPPILLAQVFNPTPEPDGAFTKSQILDRFCQDDFGKPVTLHRSMSYIHSHPDDARYKVHFLKINPECRPMKRDASAPGGVRLLDPQPLTCHAAVASTYGKYAHEYDPDMRT